MGGHRGLRDRILEAQLTGRVKLTDAERSSAWPQGSRRPRDHSPTGHHPPLPPISEYRPPQKLGNWRQRPYAWRRPPRATSLNDCSKLERTLSGKPMSSIGRRREIRIQLRTAAPGRTTIDGHQSSL